MPHHPLHRRGFIASLAGAFIGAAILSFPGTAGAVETAAFSPAALDAAKASGKSILVEITAPWCPTCRAQKPILAELLADPKFKDVVVLSVDFDSQKDAVRALKAQSQSTLIVFKGETETGRSVGDTRKASIAALLDRAL